MDKSRVVRYLFSEDFPPAGLELWDELDFDWNIHVGSISDVWPLMAGASRRRRAHPVTT